MSRTSQAIGIAIGISVLASGCQELPMAQYQDEAAPAHSVESAGAQDTSVPAPTTVCAAYTQVLEELKAAPGSSDHVATFEALVADACS
jgi:hypothetical protein